jgi:hypothetical protein
MFILVILVNVAAFEPPLEGHRYFDTMAKCEEVQKSIVRRYKEHVKIKIKCTLVS